MSSRPNGRAAAIVSALMTILLAIALLAARSPQYTIDFERYFYATPQAQAAEAAAIQKDIAALRGVTPTSPASIRTYEDLLVRSERLSAYLYLRYATDTTNTEA